jgi:hypothetical protein
MASPATPSHATSIKRSSRAVSAMTVLAPMIVLTTLAVSSCKKERKGELPVVTLTSEILAEIGDAACDSTTQCRTVAFGHKGCGGPSGYLAWSTKRNGDGKKLAAMVEREAALEKEEQTKLNMGSDCMWVEDPGVSCQAQRCVLGRARPF